MTPKKAPRHLVFPLRDIVFSPLAIGHNLRGAASKVVAMLRGLVQRFGKQGASDHLRGARRSQELADLHKLFVLTTFQARDGDGQTLVDAVLREGEGLTYDELKAKVSHNLTTQMHFMCGAVRGALRASADKGTGAHARDAVSRELLRRCGFSAHVQTSTAGPGSGLGLFVSGNVDPGEIVCVYPGVVYSSENVRHMPGYPTVAKHNPYLVSRFDGAVVDALPWGFNGGWSRSPGQSVKSTGETAVQGFGTWPGAPIGEALDEGGEEHEKEVSWLALAAGETPLDPSDLEEARAAVRAVDRRHPLALAHFANHPPKGIAPNVHVASVDVVFDARDGDEGQSGQSTASLRPYLPNVGLGRWPVPLGADEAVRRQAARTEQGKGFGGALSRMFGEKEDTETAGTGDSNDDEKIVVPTLVLVATGPIADEEVFLNYRLSTHVKRPDWYHPVDAEEDARRWATD